MIYCYLALACSFWFITSCQGGLEGFKAVRWPTEVKDVDVQWALKPLWEAYEACQPGVDTAAILQKVVKALGLSQAR